jgi:UDP-N-acetylmuramate dehydrogenase
MDNPPVDRESLVPRIVRITGEENVALDEPMSEHTTFEIGGPADLFVTPVTSDQVHDVLEVCRDAGAPVFVMGNGSNLLVADEGYRGVVVCTAGALDNAHVDGRTIRCEAGVSLSDASEMACELGLSGLEFACGIPGSVGGAVFMNAGAYGSEIAAVLREARVLTPDLDERTLSGEELEFGYRKSRVRTDGLICLAATFDLVPGEPDEIRATMDELQERRREKQPLDMPSAGSTFKRPEGHFAGKLISDAGLKGFSIGGAMVSEKHAGFVVNTGGATASDVRELIAHVQDEVERQFGVRLEPEVQMLP